MQPVALGDMWPDATLFLLKLVAKLDLHSTSKKLNIYTVLWMCGVGGSKSTDRAK